MRAHVYAVSPGTATDESASTIEISEVVGKKEQTDLAYTYNKKIPQSIYIYAHIDIDLYTQIHISSRIPISHI